MHLVALRALGDDLPVNLKLVVEGSEEQGTGGLEAFVPDHADLLRADAIIVADTGNAAVGHPAVTSSLRGNVNVVVTVEALTSQLHSGIFGGAAPDALAALVAILATLRDELGNTTIHGLTTHPELVRCALPTRPVPKRRRCVRRGIAAGRRGRLRHDLGTPRAHHRRHRLPTGGRIGHGHRAPVQCAPQPAHPAGRCARAGCRGPRPPPARGGALAGPGDRGCRGVRRRLPPSDGRARLQRDDRCHALRLRRQPRR